MPTIDQRLRALEYQRNKKDVQASAMTHNITPEEAAEVYRRFMNEPAEPGEAPNIPNDPNEAARVYRDLMSTRLQTRNN